MSSPAHFWKIKKATLAGVAAPGEITRSAQQPLNPGGKALFTYAYLAGAPVPPPRIYTVTLESDDVANLTVTVTVN
ncbi:MAG TPA: hypothetical protein VG269_02370 [Tepidisphaeraceae bacterium]|jgi:hypothetical protein|nr:hypothetical protein [Tepidisphaeraceae bacterium]